MREVERWTDHEPRRGKFTPAEDAFVRLHVAERGNQSVSAALRWAARMMRRSFDSVQARYWQYLCPGAPAAVKLITSDRRTP